MKAQTETKLRRVADYDDYMNHPNWISRWITCAPVEFNILLQTGRWTFKAILQSCTSDGCMDSMEAPYDLFSLTSPRTQGTSVYTSNCASHCTHSSSRAVAISGCTYVTTTRSQFDCIRVNASRAPGIVGMPSLKWEESKKACTRWLAIGDNEWKMMTGWWSL